MQKSSYHRRKLDTVPCSFSCRSQSLQVSSGLSCLATCYQASRPWGNKHKVVSNTYSTLIRLTGGRIKVKHFTESQQFGGGGKRCFKVQQWRTNKLLSKSEQSGAAEVFCCNRSNVMRCEGGWRLRERNLCFLKMSFYCNIQQANRQTARGLFNTVSSCECSTGTALLRT